MKSKIKRIMLNESGYFLTRQKGCYVVKKITTKEEVEKYPILEQQIGEIQIASGNLVSTGALVSACFNRVPVILKTALGSPVGVLTSIDDMSHVDTREFQWEIQKHLQSLTVCKEILLAKLKGSNEVLKKYGLRRIGFDVIEKVEDTYLGILKEEELNKYIDTGVFPLDGLDRLRKAYLNIEGRIAEYYFGQVFSILPLKLRPKNRMKYMAYDGLNNTFSLAYRILFNKCFIALLSAKLEPYLGFYHTTQWGKSALVYDFMELYRYLVDNFLIGYCMMLKEKDFVLKKSSLGSKKGARVFLNKEKNKEFLARLEEYFQSYVVARRVRFGKRQKIESLIREEAMELARFIRGEIKIWRPRVVTLSEPTNHRT